MSGIEFLADTNAFIGIMNGVPSVQIFSYEQWGYSFITRIELLSKRNLGLQESEEIEALLSSTVLIPYKLSTEKIAIELRKDFSIKIPDAFVAAAAIENSIPLITFDKDFAKISRLNTILLHH